MTAAPFRRRGRKYRDNLLDNLEADKPVDRSPLQRPQADSRRQPNRPTPDKLQPSAPNSSGAGDTAEGGVGWGDSGGGAPDDWGWGLDNPTLAAATGSYRDELQAQIGASGQGSRSTAAQSNTIDNWDGSELEDEEDWDDEAIAADDEAADSTPDVTVLDSSEVVRRRSCLTDCLTSCYRSAPWHILQGAPLLQSLDIRRHFPTIVSSSIQTMSCSCCRHALPVYLIIACLVIVTIR